MLKEETWELRPWKMQRSQSYEDLEPSGQRKRHCKGLEMGKAWLILGTVRKPVDWSGEGAWK